MALPISYFKLPDIRASQAFLSLKQKDSLRSLISCDKQFIFKILEGSTVQLDFLDSGVQEYSDLDPNLQQAFVAHLEERGVDSALGEYLMNAHDSKEQSEYLVWLSKLEKFLSKK